MSDQEQVPDVNPEAQAQEPAEQAAGTGGPALEEQLETLQRELEQTRKALSEADIRAAAEVQNVRRRAECDVEQAHGFALDKVSQDLLVVADNLERGLEALDADDESLRAAREGIELTLKSLLDVFARHGIERIDPDQQAFNPELHEAMAMVPVPGVAANSVIEVLAKGYSLNGRLLRPARVVVAKGE